MANDQHNSEHLQVIRGYLFPKAEWFTKKNIEDTLDYVPQENDLIVTSYPKTGTTWLQYIIMQIISKGSHFPSFYDITYKIVPFMEMTGIAAVEAQPKPRIYKHHIPYNLAQKNEKAKFIYIYRHPEDTLVSFYHFSQNLRMHVAEFDEYFESFVTGNIGYGSYFQHVLSFYANREDPNLLMVSYKKLHANRKEEILRIAKFLGDEHHTCLLEDDEIMNQIIEHTSFDYMKKKLTDFHPPDESNNSDTDAKQITVHFFRKGIVGDGKKVLTESQRQRIKSAAVDILQGTCILDEWYSGEK